MSLSSCNVLYCLCNCFERTGLGCVHIVAVNKLYFPDWMRYTHHDISVIWWLMYINYCFKEEYQNLTLLFTKLLKNDSQGPSFPCNVTVRQMNTHFHEAIISTPVQDCVLNHSKQDFHTLCLQDKVIGGNNNVFYDGLSQECSVRESDVYDGVYEDKCDPF